MQISCDPSNFAWIIMGGIEKPQGKKAYALCVSMTVPAEGDL